MTKKNIRTRKSCWSGKGSVQLVGLGLAVLLVAVSLLSCMTMDMSSSSAESAGTMKAGSEAGLYRVSVRSEVDPIPINTIHSWTLHVETADGKPVTDAEISIDGGMPAHGHGLPTEPKVTGNLGGGDYRVEGLKFHMQGEWVLTFSISAGGGQDTVTIELHL